MCQAMHSFGAGWQLSVGSTLGSSCGWRARSGKHIAWWGKTRLRDAPRGHCTVACSACRCATQLRFAISPSTATTSKRPVSVRAPASVRFSSCCSMPCSRTPLATLAIRCCERQSAWVRSCRISFSSDTNRTRSLTGDWSRQSMFFRGRTPEASIWRRFRASADGFTFTQESDYYAAHVVANAERVVDLFYTLCEQLSPAVDVVIEDLRSGTTWKGEGIALPDVREQIARLKILLARYGGIELSVFTSEDQLTL